MYMKTFEIFKALNLRADGIVVCIPLVSRGCCHCPFGKWYGPTEGFLAGKGHKQSGNLEKSVCE